MTIHGIRHAENRAWLGVIVHRSSRLSNRYARRGVIMLRWCFIVVSSLELVIPPRHILALSYNTERRKCIGGHTVRSHSMAYYFNVICTFWLRHRVMIYFTKHCAQPNLKPGVSLFISSFGVL